MSKIHATDIIIATVTRLGGGVMATLRLSGITDMAGILRHMRGMMPSGHPAGLVTVNVRNTSAGWASSRRVLLR